MNNLLSRIALAIAVGIGSISTMFAQLDFDNTRYRAEAGVISSQITKFGIGSPYWGFRVSGQVLLPFQRSKWALVSGLTITQKGEKSSFYYKSGEQTLTTPQDRVSMLYAQVPFNISHRFDLNRSNRIYLEFGPYLAYALSGSAGQLNIFEKRNGERGFNNIEIGLGASLHYDFKNFYLKGGLEYSLTPVVNKKGHLTGNLEGGNATSRYGLAYVMLGYQF